MELQMLLAMLKSELASFEACGDSEDKSRINWLFQFDDAAFLERVVQEEEEVMQEGKMDGYGLEQVEFIACEAWISLETYKPWNIVVHP